MALRFVDAHCHLDHDLFEGGLPQVVAKAKAAGVDRVVCAGSSPAANDKVLRFRREFAGFVFAAAGISPHDAGKISKNALVAELGRLSQWAKAGELCAIGEIGLDWHYFKERNERDAQEHVFREQLSLAEKVCLPVVVHTRKAEEAVFEVLEEFPAVRVMLHCFLKPALARKAASKGWMVSLPTLKSDSVEKIAGKIPLERLLCETDSPFLWKNEAGVDARNEPANVIFAYKRIAAARKASLEHVAEKVTQNAEKFFLI